MKRVLQTVWWWRKTDDQKSEQGWLVFAALGHQMRLFCRCLKSERLLQSMWTTPNQTHMQIRLAPNNCTSAILLCYIIMRACVYTVCLCVNVCGLKTKDRVSSTEKRAGTSESKCLRSCPDNSTYLTCASACMKMNSHFLAKALCSLARFSWMR